MANPSVVGKRASNRSLEPELWLKRKKTLREALRVFKSVSGFSAAENKRHLLPITEVLNYETSGNSLPNKSLIFTRSCSPPSR